MFKRLPCFKTYRELAHLRAGDNIQRKHIFTLSSLTITDDSGETVHVAGLSPIIVALKIEPFQRFANGLALPMGVDIDHRVGRKARRTPKAQDPQLKLLFGLYSFLARRSGSDFDKKIAHRLCLSNTNRRPFSVSRLTTALAGKDPATIAVVVGKIVNDERLLVVPKLTVAALKFSESARTRITAAGGACLTLDQLAVDRPTGEKCLLLEGDRSRREAVRHFGAAPGDDNSRTRPKIRAKGRKFEKARGRRKSRLYHV
jgi:large subunit ribosomal protein L18e